MLLLNLTLIFIIIHAVYCQPLYAPKTVGEENNWRSSLVEVDSKADFSSKRSSRHIGGGGIFGGVGVIGGGVGGFGAPAYASPSIAVVSSVPVVTTVPVVTAIPSYPIYGGYSNYGAGYGGGFGGFGAALGVDKFKVKAFGIGGGFFG